MATPVTDPALLAQLEGGGPAGRPVTDPDLLRQLEGGEERSFFGKLGSFVRNVIANPPPSVAGIRDVIRDAPAAAQELTWGADPEAAREAAGTMAGAAGLGLGFRGLGGEGVVARPRSAAPTPRPTPVPVLPSESQAAVQAAGRLDVTVPGYLATESTVTPQIAASIKNVPWAGQPIVQSAEAVTTGLGRAKGEIAPAVAPDVAGERAKSGLTGFVKTESQKPVDVAYKAAEALIDPEARAPLTNTAQLVSEMQARRANARIPGTSKAVDIVSAAVKSPLDDVAPELRAGILKRNPEMAQSAGLNYEGVKDLRTYLRDRSPQQLIAEGIDPTEAKRILGALTKDLENIVSLSGPEAFAAWQEANTLARLTSMQRQALSKVVGTVGDAAPEMVFNRLATYANSKAGADISRLRLAKRAMGPEAWDQISSAMINRLGMAPDGTFSPQRFVTAFGNMSGAAKGELFSGPQAAALSDLFIVSKHIGERITKFGNPSGTARGVAGGLVGGHLFVEPISAISTVVGTRLLAQALSRPTVVRAAAAASLASAAGDPVRTSRALARLGQVAVREGLISAAEMPPDQKFNHQRKRRTART